LNADRWVASLVALLLLSNAGYPQATPPPSGTSATQEAAHSELEKLSFLVGDWVHSEIYHATPSGPGAGRSKVAWLLGNHFLYILYATRGPWGYREARGLLSWDSGAGLYRLDWFDDHGRTLHFTGSSPKAKELALSGSLVLNGQPAEGHLLIRSREDGKLLLTIEIAGKDRKPDPLMEAVLSSVPPSE
jgi:hypothetical protein